MLKILIVGGGPAGLILAQELSLHSHFEVHLIEQKKTLGRKFLVAGDGGLNLSNNKDISTFVSEYTHQFIKNAVIDFPCSTLEKWFNDLGISTYYGSSGKLFPSKGIKPIQVLNAILNSLITNKVHIHTESRILNWDNKTVLIEEKGVVNKSSFDCVCFAMGGASWQQTGSDGFWTTLFTDKVQINPFQSSNAGFEFENSFSKDLQGRFIKNCRVFSDDKSVIGEIKITDYGLEGAPVYALNAAIRGNKSLYIDFKPESSFEKILNELQCSKKSRTDFLKSLKLGSAFDLIRKSLSKDDYLNDILLVRSIKEYPLPNGKLRPLDEAISSVGGIDMCEITPQFELKKFTNVFAIGEMLDWDTRTGGYLLQACFSMGYKVAKTLINRYEED